MEGQLEHCVIEQIDKNYSLRFSESDLAGRRYVKTETIDPLSICWVDFCFEDMEAERFKQLKEKLRWQKH